MQTPRASQPLVYHCSWRVRESHVVKGKHLVDKALSGWVEGSRTNIDVGTDHNGRHDACPQYSMSSGTKSKVTGVGSSQQALQVFHWIAILSQYPIPYRAPIFSYHKKKTLAALHIS